MLTKKKIMPDVDWEAIKYASKLRLVMKNGRILLLRGFDYWSLSDVLPDAVDGDIYEAVHMTDVEGTYIKHAVTLLPNPNIASIEILVRLDKESRGSHPEVGWSTPYLHELYSELNNKLSPN